MSRLITTSLISSIDWFKIAPVHWKAKAYEDLLNQLNRIWLEPKNAIKLGINFEKRIYNYLQHKRKTTNKDLEWFIIQCKGGEVQKKIKKFIEINDVEYCLFGKVDVYFPDCLIDIKTTSSYKGKEYYKKSFQHLLYCYITNIHYFKYLVAVFDSDGKIEDKIEIPINLTESQDELRHTVEQKVKETIEFIQADYQLMKAYKDKFCLY